MQIVPQQALHGYDSPWAPGAGKNKLVYPYYSTSATGSEVTVSVNDDGSVTLSASSAISTVSNFYLKENNSASNLKAGSYKIILIGATSSNNVQFVYGGAQSSITYGAATETTIGSFTLTTDDETLGFCLIQAKVGFVGTVKVYPMIVESSTTDMSYASYSNICPISGWTGANVQRTGKNLINIPEIVNEDTHDVNMSRNPLFLGLKYIPNTAYTFSCDFTTSETSHKWGLQVDYTDGTTNYLFIHDRTYTGKSVTTNPEKTVKRIRFVYDARYSISVSNMQLEIGSTATAYEPYHGNTYPVSWQTEAGTVYGGTLDVTTGKLTVDKLTKVFDSSLNESEITTPTTVGSSTDFKQFDWVVYRTIGVTNARFISSTFKSEVGLYGVYSSSTAARLYFGIPYEFTTKQDVINYFTTNPTTVLYPLATPIEYHLTPTEIELFLGENNVWADTGDITKLILNA